MKSPSTEALNRREKTAAYYKPPSVRESVLLKLAVRGCGGLELSTPTCT